MSVRACVRAQGRKINFIMLHQSMPECLPPDKKQKIWEVKVTRAKNYSFEFYTFKCSVQTEEHTFN